MRVFSDSSSPENFSAKWSEFALADATTPVTIMEDLKKKKKKNQESISSHRINLIKIFRENGERSIFLHRKMEYRDALHLATSNRETLLGKFSSLDVLDVRVGRYFLRACQRNFRLAWNAAAADDCERELSSSRERIRYARASRRRRRLVSSRLVVRDFVFAISSASFRYSR